MRSAPPPDQLPSSSALSSHDAPTGRTIRPVLEDHTACGPLGTDRVGTLVVTASARLLTFGNGSLDRRPIGAATEPFIHALLHDTQQLARRPQPAGRIEVTGERLVRQTVHRRQG